MPIPSAGRLFLSSWTVKTQVKSIYRKLGVSSRNDAVREATTIGLLGA
jgi:LuxR family maltose regulon positive regulatory protein